MRILIIRSFPSYMNVKNNTYNIQEVGLAKALVRRGLNCDILFWTNKEDADVVLQVDSNSTVTVFYRRGITMLKNTFFTGVKALFAKYDILQPNEYNQIQAWYLSRKYPQKTIIYHGPYYSSFNKRYNLMCKVFDVFFLRSYLKRNTKFIAKSEMAKTFLSNKGISSNNISVVGVGIDTQMLTSLNVVCNEPLYLQMNKDQDKLKILYVGRFEKRRNIHFILDVFGKVLAMRPDARLYLIGSGDPAYLQSVFDYIDTLNIRENVVWQERMEQRFLSKVYSCADFFILPAEYEIFGMVLLEAMYYRTIVLTTLNGGSGTLIQNAQNGYVFKTKDINTWVERLLKTAENQTAMQEIKDAAYKTVAELFTWDCLAQRFICQYKMICS